MTSSSSGARIRISIRRAHTADVTGVVELINAYAQEVFARDADVTPEALLGDGFGSVLEFFVAEADSGELCGFAAWEKTYDVVTGRRGGLLLGQFMTRATRGYGAGDALLRAVANEVRALGGAFLGGLGEVNAELAGSEASLFPLQQTPSAGAARKVAAADVSHAELLDVKTSLHPRR
ncbi:MAG: hypothetical protein QM756_27280 [Polyangiaceae bacterium]